jgi:hypothetical protein
LSLYAAGTFVTRSEMEERFLGLCDNHGLRRPQGVNTRIEGEEVEVAAAVANSLATLPRNSR